MESIISTMASSYRLLFGTYALIVALHVMLPSRRVKGYCLNSSGEVLEYRLNGLLVHTVIVVLFYYYDFRRAIFYENFNGTALSACLAGIVMSIWFFSRGYASKKEEVYSYQNRCDTTDWSFANITSVQDGDISTLRRSSRSRSRTRGRSSARKSSPSRSVGKSKDRAIARVYASNSAKPGRMARFFLGTEWNPRVLTIDVKMVLYLIGATYLQLNILSGIEVQRSLLGGHVTLALKAYAVLFTWFLLEYLAGEEVHLYTYDLFAEKIGAKLLWGCLFFYPFFYCIGLHSLVSSPADVTPTQAVAIVVLYFSGWAITRGANMQKYFFKRYPDKKTCFFGLVAQETLPKHPRILVGGFWGVSRHFNYCGEILQAVALALLPIIAHYNESGYANFWAKSTGYTFLPLTYPVYYLLLFIPRQFDDDALCANKYGAEVWEQYKNRVPWRIFPGVW